MCDLIRRHRAAESFAPLGSAYCLFHVSKWILRYSPWRRVQTLDGPGLAGSPVRLGQPTAPCLPFAAVCSICHVAAWCWQGQATGLPGLEGVAFVQPWH